MGNIVVYVTSGRDAPQIDENKQESRKSPRNIWCLGNQRSRVPKRTEWITAVSDAACKLKASIFLLYLAMVGTINICQNNFSSACIVCPPHEGDWWRLLSWSLDEKGNWMDGSLRTWSQESTVFRMDLRSLEGRGKRTQRERLDTRREKKVAEARHQNRGAYGFKSTCDVFAGRAQKNIKEDSGNSRESRKVDGCIWVGRKLKEVKFSGSDICLRLRLRPHSESERGLVGALRWNLKWMYYCAVLW